MPKKLVLPLIISILTTYNIYSQYTESINTYRPGTSFGAFSVGKNVVQGEAGIGISRQSHSIFENKTRGFEFQYLFRAGLIFEQLEFSLQGGYTRNNVLERIGNVDGSFIRKGFSSNVLGAKYLIYDPYKYGKTKKVNIRSWKANKKFNFKKLIPAVSAFAGASFISKNSDFAFHNNLDNRATKIQSSVSPKILIAAQNNWTDDLVFVSNLVFDDITTEFFDLRFIFTTTYNFQDRWAILGEYELANSKIYKDNIFRVGGTYLINDDFQVDASVHTGTKSTPYTFTANAGVSYRLDFHKPQDDLRIKTGEMKEIEEDIEQIKKDIEDGLLPPDTMKGKYKGVNLEDYIDDEEDSEFDNIENDSLPKKKRWWQRIGSKRKRFRKAIKDTANTNNDSTGVSTRKVLGTGGRINEFADDEFLEEKRESIRPKERTPEEQAAYEARLEAEQAKMSKRKRRKSEPLIDPLTNEPFTEEEMDSMSKREIKRLRKEQEELNMLDDELESLMNETEVEMSTRDKARAAKKAAKEAKKKAKANRKAGIIDDVSIEEPAAIPSSIEDIDKELEKLKAEEEKESKAERKAREKEEKRLAKEAKKKAKEEEKLEDDDPNKW